MPPAAQAFDRFEDRVATLGIDPDGRLVEDQEQWFVQEADGDVEATLHAARVLLAAIVGAVGQPDGVEHDGDACVELGAAETLEATEQPQVLGGGEVRVDREILGYVSEAGLQFAGPVVQVEAYDLDGAGVATQQPAEHRDRGRLARAVGTQQPVGLARGDRERDIVHGNAIAETPRQSLAAQRGFHAMILPTAALPTQQRPPTDEPSVCSVLLGRWSRRRRRLR